MAMPKSATELQRGTMVDDIRALFNERAVLIAQRRDIDGRIGLIDDELSEVRRLLEDVDTPKMAPAEPVPAPRAVSAMRVVEPPAAEATTGQPDDRRRQGILDLLTQGPLPTREIAKRMRLDRFICKMTLQRMKKVGLLVSTGITSGQRWALPGTSQPPAAEPKHETAPKHDRAREDAEPVEARDAAVLQRITGNNGVATIQELRRWFFAHAVINGGGTDEKKAEALINSLLRLKAKRTLARTGDTWSVVGAGAASA